MSCCDDQVEGRVRDLTRDTGIERVRPIDRKIADQGKLAFAKG